MIAREVDAIILQTVDTDALKRDIGKAAEADIPVFPTSVSTDPDDILGAVVVDLEAVGRLDAQWVADDAGGRGRTGRRRRGRAGCRLRPAHRRLHQGPARQRRGGRRAAGHVRRRQGRGGRRRHGPGPPRPGR
ncbi:substrate-binding domain-containing protein [Streptomyces tendae]|uniref:substrate-binding domain-containing protein n=1 Tax=Streptomyces tendae TaxID=1932 RepID=UPI0036F84729